MPKTLIRFVAFFLVPCLVMDPSFASASMTSLSQTGESANIARVRGSIFDKQALIPPDYGAQYAQASYPDVHKRIQVIRSIIRSPLTLLGFGIVPFAGLSLLPHGQLLPVNSLVLVATKLAIAVSAFSLLYRFVLTPRPNSWVRRFMARPGALLSTVAVATALGEISNFWAYIHLNPAHSSLGYVATQIFFMTIGILFAFRIVFMVVSSAWIVATPSEAPPTPYTLHDPELPVVTVQIPIRAEPFDVAKMTLDSAMELHYPKDRLEIQIIDNSDKPEQYAQIREYAESHGATFIHRDGTQGFKAGNLMLGMQKARGDYFFVLDADSTVEPDSLLKAMPEFERDPRLGFAALHRVTSNEDASRIAKMYGMGMRAYERISEIRNRQGFVKFDGHNGIISRPALEAVGGWSFEVSEDLATSIKMRLAGFHGKYIPYVTTGEWAAVTLPELMKQHRKWAYGTFGVLTREAVPILRTKQLTWFEKMDILFQMSGYALSSLGFILIFSYIRFPVSAGLVVLFSSYLPIIAANYERPAMELAEGFMGVTLAFSGLLTTLLTGTWNAVIGRKEGFRVTLKDGPNKIPLRDLLRDHFLGIFAATLFFGFLPFIYPNIPSYLMNLPPAVPAMLSVVAAPFVFNYLNRHRSRAKVHSSWRRALAWSMIGSIFPLGAFLLVSATGWSAVLGSYFVMATVIFVGIPLLTLLVRHIRSPRVPANDVPWQALRVPGNIFALSALLVLFSLYTVIPNTNPHVTPPIATSPRSGSFVRVVHSGDGDYLSVNGQSWSGVPGYAYQPTPSGRTIKEFENGRLALIYKALLPPHGDGIDAKRFPDLVLLARRKEGAPANDDARQISAHGGKFIRTYAMGNTTKEDLQQLSRIFQWMYETHGLMFTVGLYDPADQAVRDVAVTFGSNPGLLMYDGWRGSYFDYGSIDYQGALIKSIDPAHPIGIIVTLRLVPDDILGVQSLKNFDMVLAEDYSSPIIRHTTLLAAILQKAYSPKALSINEIGISTDENPDLRAQKVREATQELLPQNGKLSPVLTFAWFEWTSETWKRRDDRWRMVDTPSLDAAAEMMKRWSPQDSKRTLDQAALPQESPFNPNQMNMFGMFRDMPAKFLYIYKDLRKAVRWVARKLKPETQKPVVTPNVIPKPAMDNDRLDSAMNRIAAAAAEWQRQGLMRSSEVFLKPFEQEVDEIKHFLPIVKYRDRLNWRKRRDLVIVFADVLDRLRSQKPLGFVAHHDGNRITYSAQFVSSIGTIQTDITLRKKDAAPLMIFSVNRKESPRWVGEFRLGADFVDPNKVIHLDMVRTPDKKHWIHYASINEAFLYPQNPNGRLNAFNRWLGGLDRRLDADSKLSAVGPPSPFNPNETNMFGFLRDMGAKFRYIFTQPGGIVHDLARWLTAKRLLLWISPVVFGFAIAVMTGIYEYRAAQAPVAAPQTTINNQDVEATPHSGIFSVSKSAKDGLYAVTKIPAGLFNDDFVTIDIFPENKEQTLDSFTVQILTTEMGHQFHAERGSDGLPWMLTQDGTALSGDLQMNSTVSDEKQDGRSFIRIVIIPGSALRNGMAKPKKLIVKKMVIQQPYYVQGDGGGITLRYHSNNRRTPPMSKKRTLHSPTQRAA